MAADKVRIELNATGTLLAASTVTPFGATAHYRCHAISLTADATVKLKFTDTDDQDVNHGPIYLGTGGPYVVPHSQSGCFDVPVGKGIKLVLVSGTGNFGGYIEVSVKGG